MFPGVPVEPLLVCATCFLALRSLELLRVLVGVVVVDMVYGLVLGSCCEAVPGRCLVTSCSIWEPGA